MIPRKALTFSQTNYVSQTIIFLNIFSLFFAIYKHLIFLFYLSFFIFIYV